MSRWGEGRKKSTGRFNTRADLETRTANLKKTGLTNKVIAERVGVSETTVNEIVRELRDAKRLD